jgi:hypothetical protein
MRGCGIRCDVAGRIVQWGGVGDDDHADDRLLRERVAAPTIVFEVVLRVAKIHAVLLDVFGQVKGDLHDAILRGSRC